MAFTDYGGIFATFPTLDPDAGVDPGLDDEIHARSFACPGAGNQVINKIGAWIERGASPTKCRFLIYTDSSGSPGTIVANSLTTEVTLSLAAWISFTYSTKPVLVGGTTYWLATWGSSTGGLYDFSPGYSVFTEFIGKYTAQVYSSGGTPSGESWTDLNNLVQLAAEYQAEGGGGGGVYSPIGSATTSGSATTFSGLFIIDAETGNTNQFTGIAQSGATTFTAQSGTILHGSYSFLSHFAGAYAYAYGYKNLISNYTELYTRMYFRIGSLALTNGQYVLLLTMMSGGEGGTEMAQFRLYQKATNQYGYMYCCTDQTGFQVRVNNSTVDVFNPSETHYIEVHTKIGTTDGIESLLIDGTSVYSATNIDNHTYNMNCVQCGVFNGSTPTSGDVYTDDLKISQTGPIGAYPTSGVSSIITKVFNFFRMRRNS